jgi:hypothetical protein
MVAMGWVMTVYQHDPTVIKPSYYNLMLRYFGHN